MISFTCDYSEGAHPKILERLTATNFEQLPGYGTDHYCESAKEKIRVACEAPEAEVFFLVGGTQTNSTIIAAMLADYEGVVSAETGHIGVHEAGAVEYTGHKVLTIPSHHGKVDPKELRDYLEAATTDPNYEHMVFPGMVYISFPTEYGTIYSKAELEEIHAIAAHYGLPLMIDGARLGYGLTSPACDLTLPELASLCEVFYIGGTKVGCLCGEAVVFPRGNAPKHFYTITKQHGAMLAKGRVLGIQFDTLFTDNLYFEISRHAIDMAMQLKELLRQKGCAFFIDSPTNQQFIVLENKKIEELGKHV
ncbi:MAG: amino acid lyase, partial [Bacteroidales bacterium]|nr:amino acid lyase [Bacteroidales bacterium]